MGCQGAGHNWATEQPCDPAVPLLGRYRKELKTGMQANPAHRCSQQHDSQNRGVARRWKEPKYTLADEGTIQVWQSHTTDRHSAMERGDVMTRATMGRNRHARWKKPDTKGHFLWVPTDVKCPEWTAVKRLRDSRLVVGTGWGKDLTAEWWGSPLGMVNRLRTKWTVAVAWHRAMC